MYVTNINPKNNDAKDMINVNVYELDKIGSILNLILLALLFNI